MKFSNLYIAAIIFGLIGALGGAFAGGFIAAATCDGGLECLGTAFLGVGLEAIVAESCVMTLAVHNVNNGRGNLLLTCLPTLALAVPILYALMLGFTAPLAVPLFLFQAWVCVKVQLATHGKRGAVRRARSGSR
ncbi:MAG: hypothetical protein IH872_00825 [Chloroflexi bacterium]|nr:hypothetical protein [Chloroflexota bacterium]